MSSLILINDHGKVMVMNAPNITAMVLGVENASWKILYLRQARIQVFYVHNLPPPPLPFRTIIQTFCFPTSHESSKGVEILA